MNRIPIILLIPFAFLLLVSTGTTRPQSSDLDALKSVVVRLSVHWPNSDETAAGIFIGQDQQKAYFITACHAIINRCKTSSSDPVERIRLQFSKSQTQHEAFVFDSFDGAADLGVVWTAVGNLPSGISKITEKAASAGAAVRIIGHPSAGGWSLWTGNVQNENSPDVLRFTTTRNASLADGYSGGGVFDSEGEFIGMHSETTTSYGVEVKTSEILNRLRAWGVPTSNIGAQRDDRESILSTLDRYVSAYNQKDAAALWKVWPTAAAQTRRTVEDAFKAAQSISVTLSNVAIINTPSGATATARFSQIYTVSRGQAPPPVQNQPIVFDLKRNNGEWTINSIK